MPFIQVYSPVQCWISHGVSVYHITRPEKLKSWKPGKSVNLGNLESLAIIAIWGQIDEDHISSSRAVNLMSRNPGWIDVRQKMPRPLPKWLLRHAESFTSFPFVFVQHPHVQNSLNMGEQGQSFPIRSLSHGAMGSISFNISWQTNPHDIMTSTFQSWAYQAGHIKLSI